MVLFLGGLIVASRNDFELIIDKTCDVRRRNFSGAWCDFINTFPFSMLTSEHMALCCQTAHRGTAIGDCFVTGSVATR